MSALQIDLDGRDRFVPGERLSVAAAWELDRTPAWLELTLRWRLGGRDASEAATAWRHRWTPVDPAGVELIDVTLPPGPWTFAGRLVAVGWQFRLAAEGEDESARQPVTLRPTADA